MPGQEEGRSHNCPAHTTHLLSYSDQDENTQRPSETMGDVTTARQIPHMVCSGYKGPLSFLSPNSHSSDEQNKTQEGPQALFLPPK